MTSLLLLFAMLAIFRAFPFLYLPPLLARLDLHCLGQRNKLVQMIENDSIEHLPSNAIIMIFQLTLSNVLSRGFVGFRETCVF